ncbi:hypothetical protein HRI_000413700 [Hibiscus trionum]|uniref:Uncharacterized protein n=1 Tax=Hibiscus trionum TaxID=183268 RepID=A0A9W7LKB7_HIBTR|nr:hypothetical protein HRI_000413700 [Hibiscus trionum]
MGSVDRVDEQGEGSSKQYSSDYEVDINEIKPLSSHGCSNSYSSTHELFDLNVTNIDNENPKPSRLKSSSNLRVSIASSSEMQVYLSNRIPSSVFRVKSGTHTDWSAASNESLFSIHINNCSYSKDQFLMLYKSGEMTKLDEQIIAQKNGLPSLKELDDMAAAAMNEEIDKGSGKAATAVETGEVAEDDSEPEEVQGSASISNAPMVRDGAVGSGSVSMEKKPTAEANKPINSLSDLYEERSISISFTFPVLTAADGGRHSSACADQNKGLPTQLQPPQQQPQEEEKQQKEKEEESTLPPQDDSSKSWLSLFSCCGGS